MPSRYFIGKALPSFAPSLLQATLDEGGTIRQSDVLLIGEFAAVLEFRPQRMYLRSLLRSQDMTGGRRLRQRDIRCNQAHDCDCRQA
jgi:hypothetical protein